MDKGRPIGSTFFCALINTVYKSAFEILTFVRECFQTSFSAILVPDYQLFKNPIYLP